MIHVKQAQNELICCICHHRIRKGDVLVISIEPGDDGQMAWRYLHIWCDAYRRNKQIGPYRRRLLS